MVHVTEASSQLLAKIYQRGSNIKEDSKRRDEEHKEGRMGRAKDLNSSQISFRPRKSGWVNQTDLTNGGLHRRDNLISTPFQPLCYSVPYTPCRDFKSGINSDIVKSLNRMSV